jgi:hypothetical protein
MVKMRHEVAVIVNDRLAKVNSGLTFEVIRDGVRQEHDWWHVPVIATRRGRDLPRQILIDIFANVETELEELHGLTVLFIPAGTDERPEAPESLPTLASV